MYRAHVCHNGTKPTGDRTPEGKVTRSGEPDSLTDAGKALDPVLRAKYLDYCSARIADALLDLSADEMYLLARDAARELGREEEAGLSYDVVVRLATERISRTIALPDPTTWARAYQEDPERFEQEMLGLWRYNAPAPDELGREGDDG